MGKFPGDRDTRTPRHMHAWNFAEIRKLFFACKSTVEAEISLSFRSFVSFYISVCLLNRVSTNCSSSNVSRSSTDLVLQFSALYECYSSRFTAPCFIFQWFPKLLVVFVHTSVPPRPRIDTLKRIRLTFCMHAGVLRDYSTSGGDNRK